MPFAFFGPWINPTTASEAALQQLYNAFGNIYPPTGQSTSGNSRETQVSKSLLMNGAKTFRQRAFTRCFGSIFIENGDELMIQLKGGKTGLEWNKFKITPRSYSVSMLMGAVNQNKEARAWLSKLPIVGPLHDHSADPEVCIPLQDLADAVSQEGTNAFKAKYFPGIPSITIPEDHVDALMIAMQREMDRESKRVALRPAIFTNLSRDRQRALAERRRWWFDKFGITPVSWQTGRFSIWKIANEPIEEYAKWITFNSQQIY